MWGLSLEDHIWGPWYGGSLVWGLKIFGNVPTPAHNDAIKYFPLGVGLLKIDNSQDSVMEAAKS